MKGYASLIQFNILFYLRYLINKVHDLIKTSQPVLIFTYKRVYSLTDEKSRESRRSYLCTCKAGQQGSITKGPLWLCVVKQSKGWSKNLNKCMYKTKSIKCCNLR